MGYRSSDFLILTSLRVVAPSPSPAVPLFPSRPNRGEGGNVLLAVQGLNKRKEPYKREQNYRQVLMFRVGCVG